MLVWALLAIGIGIFNLIASIYYYQDPVFLQVNGYIFVLVGIALGFRMRMKKREGRIEQLEARVKALESRTGIQQ